jgi:hypothetical protein
MIVQWATSQRLFQKLQSFPVNGFRLSDRQSGQVAAWPGEACGTHHARISPGYHDDRDSGRHVSSCICRSGARCHEEIDTRADQLLRQSREMISRVSPTGLDRDRLPIDPAQLAQLLRERIKFTGLSLIGGRPGEEQAHARPWPCLLCLGGERRGEEAEDQRENQYGSWLDGEPSRVTYDLIGSVNVKVEPFPTWLFTQIRPPCSSTNFRARARPSPVPSTFLSAVPTCRNSSNTAS